MSIDTRLRNALLPFNLPVESSVYTGKAEKYLTFNYSTIPISFGDDEPERERYLIQVHLFAPLDDNINSLVRQIKTALFEADCLYPETINADDANNRHIVFETEAVDEV